MRHAALVLLGAMVLLGGSGHRAVASPRAGFLFEEITVEGRDYPYAVYVPRGLDVSDPVPAILFLHGMGESGTDGSRPLAVGLGPAIMLEPERWPFVVIMPQKPTPGSAWEDHADAVLAILHREIERHGIDPDRIGLTGLSQGGHGAMVLGARYPGRWACVAPICGYGPTPGRRGTRAWVTDPADPAVRAIGAGLADLPVWLFHGAADAVVPVEQSRLIAGAVEAAGGQAKLTIYPDVGHNSWDKAYRESGLWTWFAEHLE